MREGGRRTGDGVNGSDQKSELPEFIFGLRLLIFLALNSRPMKLFFSIALGLLAVWTVIMSVTGRDRTDDGRVKLVWVSDDNPARRAQVDLFNKENSQAYVTLDPESSGKEKVVVQCLSGVGPDLLDIFDGFELTAFVRAGIAMDITDELKQHGISIEKDVWAGTHTTAMLNGRVYGFPRSASVDALLFNRALFDRAGLKDPGPFTTGDQFLAMAKALTVRDEQGRPKQFGFQFEWWQYRHFLRQWNAHLYSADGTRCVLDSPEAVAAIQYMRDLIWEYHVTPTPAEVAAMPSGGGYGTGKINLFGSGQAAMALAGRWWMPILRNNFKDLSFGVSECQFGPQRQYRAYCAVTAVNQFSRHRKEALEFLFYMASPEYNQLINSQADSMGPIKKYALSGDFLSASEFPDEACNAVWLSAMEHSVPDGVSPFVSGAAANRIITRQLDLVANNLKSPQEAMETSALLINDEIAKTVAGDPELQKLYHERTTH